MIVCESDRQVQSDNPDIAKKNLLRGVMIYMSLSLVGFANASRRRRSRRIQRERNDRISRFWVLQCENSLKSEITSLS
jgi:hypothetical protein